MFQENDSVASRAKTLQDYAASMAVATSLNFLDRFVPTSVTAVIMTTAINAAIRPYSIAVAPSSSWIKCFNIRILYYG